MHISAASSRPFLSYHNQRQCSLFLESCMNDLSLAPLPVITLVVVVVVVVKEVSQ